MMRTHCCAASRVTLAPAPFTACLHRVRYLALPVGDSRDRAAVELQVESSTAALEPVPLGLPEVVDVVAEPVVSRGDV
jgi:hypothetical protein